MTSSRAPRTWEEYAFALGVNLRRLRDERGLTQEELAHRAGTTRNHYQLLERGYWQEGRPSNPRLNVLVHLALALDVALDELLPAHDRLNLDERR